MQPELENYIKENLAKGVPKDQIHQELLQKGWKASDIDTAFSQLEAPPSPPLSSLPPFPINQSPTPTAPTQPKEKKPLLKLLKPKILIILIVIIVLSAGAGGSYLYLSNKTGLPNLNPLSKTAEESQDITVQEADLKTCPDVPPPNTQESETNIKAKFVLNYSRNTSIEETTMLDLETSEEIPLETEGQLRGAYFSPNGNYLIYFEEFYQDKKAVYKFFLYDRITNTKSEIIPTFLVNELAKLVWSLDSKQFLISQPDEKTYKTTEANYFNADNLSPHDIKNLAENWEGQNFMFHQFSGKDELIVRNVQHKSSPVKFNFSKVNFINGSITHFRSFSINPLLGTDFGFGPSILDPYSELTPDFKYYLFVEKEAYDPYSGGKVENEAEFNKKSSKELKAYLGYLNIGENCLKKVEITQPVYWNTDIRIAQFSEDNKKVSIRITGPKWEGAQVLGLVKGTVRVDIASLTALKFSGNQEFIENNGIISTVNGEKIYSIQEFSSLFNYAIVETDGGKKAYLVNIKTDENKLISATAQSFEIRASSLKEVPK